MITTTRREQGPPTSCHRCGEGSIYGFDVVDTAHGIHRVLCADCARVAVEVAERPCEGCGVMVPEDEHTGYDKPDGTSEYLCPDCPSDELVRAAAPDLVAYKRYIEANLERIERGGWTPVCFDEFITSEERETYSKTGGAK
tara:strand:+ start:790 stop:1212 length:423 start_codon:yes stop_codon:yes gene_type:complete